MSVDLSALALFHSKWIDTRVCVCVLQHAISIIILIFQSMLICVHCEYFFYVIIFIGLELGIFPIAAHNCIVLRKWSQLHTHMYLSVSLPPFFAFLSF